MFWLPARWKIELLTDKLVTDLRKEIGMAESFFHETSVLVLVFGLLDAYISGKLTPQFGWFIVSITVAAYVLALLTEWLARCLFGVCAVWILFVQEVVIGRR